MNWEAPTGTTWFKPFGGAGLGVYIDKVNEQLGVVPALAIKVGIRSGGARFGIQLEISALVGEYDFFDIGMWVFWPMIHYGVGVYFAF